MNVEVGIPIHPRLNDGHYCLEDNEIRYLFIF